MFDYEVKGLIDKEDLKSKLVTMSIMDPSVNMHLNEMLNIILPDFIIPISEKENASRLWDETFRQYFYELENQGFIKTKEYVKNANLINLRSLYKMKGTNIWSFRYPFFDDNSTVGVQLQLLNYVGIGKIYSYIPLFNEGTYRINKARYLYFKIDPESFNNTADKISYNIEISDFGIIKGTWEFIRSANCTVSGYKELVPKEKVDFKLNNYKMYKDTFRLIDNFADKNKRYSTAMKYILNTADVINRNLENDEGVDKSTHPIDYLVLYFFMLTKYINRIVEDNKVSRAKKEKEITKVKNEVKFENGTSSNKEERRLRTIGDTGVSVYSVDVPKPVTTHTIVYRTPSWVSKSYTYTNKNGKIVLVPSHMNYRHGLENTDKEIPTTIKVNTFDYEGRSYTSFNEACKEYGFDEKDVEEYREQYHLSKLEALECMIFDRDRK